VNESTEKNELFFMGDRKTKCMSRAPSLSWTYPDDGKEIALALPLTNICKMLTLQIETFIRYLALSIHSAHAGQLPYPVHHLHHTLSRATQNAG